MSPRTQSTMTSFGVLFATILFSPMTAAAVSCESLASLSLPNTTITSAATVGAGAFTPPAGGGGRGDVGAPFRNLPAFCRVTATLKPTSDSDIKMEVWMPVTGWNGNFQGNGSGCDAAEDVIILAVVLVVRIGNLVDGLGGRVPINHD